jgi:flagellar biosynthesis component FlhA
MYDNKIITHGVKSESKKDYGEGTVEIKVKKNINLNPNNYRKRIKIYDSHTGK